MTAPFPIAVIGRGKVGAALSAAWRKHGWPVSLHRGRAKTAIDAELVVLAVPDGAIREIAAQRPIRARAVVHCAGALGPEALAGLLEASVAVGQLHPLLSFADRRRSPLDRGGFALVQGDPRAVAIASRAARAIDLVPVAARVDATLYHAAAALSSNGAVALAALSVELMVAAGVERGIAARMLAPLLASTAANIAALGPYAALTGPVRRADAETVARHLRAIAATGADRVALVREILRAEVAVATKAGAPAKGLEAIDRLLSK